MKFIRWIQSLFTGNPPQKTPDHTYVSEKAAPFIRAMEEGNKGEHRLTHMPPPRSLLAKHIERMSVSEIEYDQPIRHFKARRNPIPVSPETRAGLDAFEKRQKDQDSDQ